MLRHAFAPGLTANPRRDRDEAASRYLQGAEQAGGRRRRSRWRPGGKSWRPHCLLLAGASRQKSRGAGRAFARRRRRAAVAVAARAPSTSEPRWLASGLPEPRRAATRRRTVRSRRRRAHPPRARRGARRTRGESGRQTQTPRLSQTPFRNPVQICLAPAGQGRRGEPAGAPDATARRPAGRARTPGVRRRGVAPAGPRARLYSCFPPSAPVTSRAPAGLERPVCRRPSPSSAATSACPEWLRRGIIGTWEALPAPAGAAGAAGDGPRVCSEAAAARSLIGLLTGTYPPLPRPYPQQYN
ncbi:hypothetical protein PVAP13_5NG553386 [Panicum virgatum]|uniref:Uncharacterized protein n=1 Tax=Panicum virgatum TaxID=38727 RepID=A0A8T0S5J7_PANVG|nr:hypothetical protein PVAP13_5NG553386 [Panicum virgatum]